MWEKKKCEVRCTSDRAARVLVGSVVSVFPVYAALRDIEFVFTIPASVTVLCSRLVELRY